MREIEMIREKKPLSKKLKDDSKKQKLEDDSPASTSSDYTKPLKKKGSAMKNKGPVSIMKNKGPVSVMKNKGPGSPKQNTGLNSKFYKTPLESNKGKPNWREVKKKSLELKKKRKESSKSFDYEKLVKAKKLWEQGRSQKCPAKEKEKIAKSLFDILNGNFQKVIYSHDMARVVQWLFKTAPKELQFEIVCSMKADLLSMLQNKYSIFCVKTILKRGTNECRKIVLDIMQENVVKLTGHAIARQITDYAYTVWASPPEKKAFVMEFYGDVFKMNSDKLADPKEIFASKPDVKSCVLESMKTSIGHIIDKGLISNIFKAVTLNFLDICTPTDRDEILKSLRPYCLDLLGSKEGVHLSMMCCWSSTVKEKKKIMIGLKGKVKEKALMEHDCLFLMALIDSVDDTVALKKYILQELSSEVLTLAADDNGRKVILYTVAHRDTAYFHPKIIQMLQEGDASDTKKKSLQTCLNEIQQAVLPVYLESIASNCDGWFISGSLAMVAKAILLIGKGPEWEKAASAVVKLICSDAVVFEGDKSYPIVEHNGCHIVVKKLIQDGLKHKDENMTFAHLLAEEIGEETLIRWVTINRACFILVFLLESKVQEIIQVLTSKFSREVLDLLSQQSTAGSSVLKKHLKEVGSILL